jgi:hypothetical protein
VPIEVVVCVSDTSGSGELTGAMRPLDVAEATDGGLDGDGVAAVLLVCDAARLDTTETGVGPTTGVTGT